MTISDQISKLKKGIASSATPENFKESMRKKLAELEAKEASAPEKKEVSPAKKKAAKKKTKWVPKHTAKKAGDDKEPGCDELLKRYEERRAASKASQKKAKTTSVFTKIAGDVADAVSKAIKNTSAEDIKDAPKATINKFDTLKTAAENFLKAFKSVLGEDYKASESDPEIKELETLIGKLETKYLKEHKDNAAAEKFVVVEFKLYRPFTEEEMKAFKDNDMSFDKDYADAAVFDETGRTREEVKTIIKTIVKDKDFKFI